MRRRDFIDMAAGAMAAGVMAAALTGRSRSRRAGARQATAETLDAAAWRAARRFAQTPFGNIAYVERGQRASGAVPARLSAQRLPVARRDRAAVAVPPLHRAGFPRPGLHRSGRRPERRARRAGRDARGLARRARRSRASTSSPTTAAARSRSSSSRSYPRAGAHAAADQLRCRDRLPAAGAAAGHRDGARGHVRRTNGSRRGWPTRRWRVRREGLGWHVLHRSDRIRPTRRSRTTSRRW